MENYQYIRVYARLFRQGSEFRRLCVMLEPQMIVTEVKKKIDEEFIELFPGESHFQVGRIEDENSFVLSN